jgi:hypothetical protein
MHLRHNRWRAVAHMPFQRLDGCRETPSGEVLLRCQAYGKTHSVSTSLLAISPRYFLAMWHAHNGRDTTYCGMLKPLPLRSPPPQRIVLRAPYDYCDNAPTTLSDPSGLLPPPCPRGSVWRRVGWLCEYRTTIQASNPTSDGCDSPWGGDFDDWDFTAACNAHDLCYGKCGNSQYSCDVDFLSDMLAVCDSSTLPQDRYEQCNYVAYLFYNYVRFLGVYWFNSAQDEYCLWQKCCCPS